MSARHQVGGDDYKVYAGERHASRQFPVETTVRFLWRDPDEALHMGVGLSHHISRSDIWIRAQRTPSLGTSVQVIVDMPPARANARSARLTGHGIVVRVEYESRQAVIFAVKVCFQQRWAYRPAPLGKRSALDGGHDDAAGLTARPAGWDTTRGTFF